MAKAQDITNIVKQSLVAISAKGIAHYLCEDADSAQLRKIEEMAWDEVDAGRLVTVDLRDEGQGLFFKLIQRSRSID